jgi:hypothetical protein
MEMASALEAEMAALRMEKRGELDRLQTEYDSLLRQGM